MTELTALEGRALAAENAEPAKRREERVLFHGLEKPKAGIFSAIFSRHHLLAVRCADVAALCAEIEAGAGVAVIEGRKLRRDDWTRLSEMLSRQPAWSDFPLIVLMEGKIVLDTEGLDPDPAEVALFLEASVSTAALLNAVRMSLRARRRQYELRDREQLEKRLDCGASLEANEFADIAINSLPGVFYVLDDNGKLLHWNKALEHVTGYSSNEVAQMNALQFFAPAYQTLIKERILQAFKVGKSSTDAPVLTRDGRQIPYFFTGKRRVIGDRIFLIGMGMEVTEQKRAEARLRELHELAEQRVAELNAVIESMPDAVYIGNENGMTKCNTNALKQLGISSLDELKAGMSDLSGKFAIRWPDGRRLKLEELQFTRALRGEVAIDEVVARKVDTGEEVYLRAASAPVVMNGKIIGAVAVNSDITDRRRAEETMRQARDRVGRHANELEKRVAERTQNLQATIQSLEGVLYHVAHDLRAPLRTMQGFTTILMEEYSPKLGEEGGDYARRISGAASRMDKLIQDLLAYGRLAHATLSPTTVDLDRQIKILLGRMNTEIEHRKAVVRVGKSLPAVSADPHVLDQILAQLLNNALTFVAPGVKPKIHISAGQLESGMVRISIRDNGLGIAPEHHERIFRVFERLQISDANSGTGIGLAIVRKGAERMGGAAGVDSKLGAGSLFWLDLPAAFKNE